MQFPFLKQPSFFRKFGLNTQKPAVNSRLDYNTGRDAGSMIYDEIITVYVKLS